MVRQIEDQIPTWWQYPELRRFMEFYRRPGASPVLFVGSGLSISAGLPTWRDLLTHLAQEHDESRQGAPILTEVNKLLQKEHPSRDQYQEAGSLVEAAFLNDLGEERWRAALERILNGELPGKSELHDAVAQLSWFRIITTNYDVLLERAALESSRYANVRVTHPWKHDFQESMVHETAQPYIVKIHGSIDDSASHLVLSRETYNELYYGAMSKIYRQVLGNILRSASVILFLGYSHDDPYLRELFKEEMYQVAREKIFAVVPREGSLAEFYERISARSLELRATFITYSLDNDRPADAHHELRELLTYLADPNSYDSHYRSLYHIRKPTVIMLHCGGTIGSEPSLAEKYSADQPLEVVVKRSRYDKGLQDFSRKLLRWYESSYNAGEEFHIDILWEILPEEFQMFSENATPELWEKVREKLEQIIFKYFQAPTLEGAMPLTTDHPLSSLFNEEDAQYRQANDGEPLTERRFLSDFTNRYIMGIVVLFGTDTLAYAAPALALSLQHLPCPVIMTGANQPPQEKNRGEFYATSDAWTNLSTSLYFLQCFGHRLTEMFVCFGDTIHNSINLRKTATEIIPSGRPWFASQYSEPFAFRNLSLHAQYMFKSIDGIFCNNYYPRTVHYFSMISDRDEFKSYRHIRFDALEDVPPKTTIGDHFSPDVAAIDVSPGFPPIDVRKLVHEKIRVVLVEGYASGTYPSHANSRFTQFAQKCREAGIPIALISRYGRLASQQGYKVEEHSDGPPPMLDLYGIIAETALPLLSIILAQCPESTWKRATLEERIELLRARIDEMFSLRPNILSLELEKITNRRDMADLLREAQERTSRKHEERVKEFENRGLFPKYETVRPIVEYRKEHFMQGVTVLPESDLRLMLEEFAHIFEKVQAGPEGFEAVFNVGFNAGVPLWNSFRMAQDNVDIESSASGDESTSHGLSLYFEETGVPQGRLKQANQILSHVTRLLDTVGITRTIRAQIETRDRAETVRSLRRRSMRLHISSYRFQPEPRSNERYAVMTFSENERRFFEALSRGARDEAPEKFASDLRARYDHLLKHTWRHSSQMMDWLVLGLFKGAACGAVSFLRLDDLALHAGGDSNLTQQVRRRVKTDIESIDGPIIRVSYDYVEWMRADEEAAR